MALQTFHNLGRERNDFILKASYQEFAFNTYQTASLSNIVKKVGVAKGSFYRYFENKSSLYSYLLDNAYKMRMEQLGGLLENKNLGFFEIIRENFRNKVQFDLSHPLESIFLYNAYLESNSTEVAPLIQNQKIKIHQFVIDLIYQFQIKGELNPSVSAELAAHFIFQTQLGIYDYLAVIKGINFRESIKNGRVFAVPEDEVMAVVNDILSIIKSGLKG